MLFTCFQLWILPCLTVANTIGAVLSNSRVDDVESANHAAFLAADREHIRLYSKNLRKRGIKITLHDAQPFTAASLATAQAYTLPLYPHTRRSTDSLALLTSLNEQNFLVPLTVGSQKFLTILDTGSADTWLAGPTFACNAAASTPNKDCGFGPRFNPAKSTSYKTSTVKFSITYGAESLRGMRATERVELAGLVSPNQSIAVVESGYWRGDGKSSGLLGLAFPSTSAMWNPLNKGANEAVSPVFTSLVRSGSIAPVFSISLGRGSETGQLTMGGAPAAKTDGRWAKSPMQYLSFERDPPEAVVGQEHAKAKAGQDFGHYRITVSGFSVLGAPNLSSRRAQLAVDSGTAHSILPVDVTAAINKRFKPSAKKDRTWGWTVPCNAKMEGGFGIKIGDFELKVDEKDVIIPPENPGMPCLSAVQEMSWPGGGLLGSSFLKGNVAVFDVGAAEMRFAKRVR